MINLTQFYPSTNVYYSSEQEVPLQSKDSKSHILIWVDDHPENNERLENEIKNSYSSHQLKILRYTSTKEALDRCDRLHYMFKNSNIRIITDMVREEDGKIEYSAGDNFINEMIKREYFQESNCLWIKIFNSKSSRDEVEAYLRFWPQYLSLGWDFWRNAQSDFLQNPLLNYYTYDIINWNETINSENEHLNNNNLKIKSTCNKFEIYLIESIVKGFNEKLSITKQVCDFSLEKIDFVYNKILWSNHRSLYKRYWQKIYEEFTSEENIQTKLSIHDKNDNIKENQSHKKTKKSFINPKRLIVYHGTSPNNFSSIFNEGLSIKKKGKLDGGWFGSGLYVTTQPQYAAHYTKYQGVDPSSMGLKFPIEVRESMQIIGGFCIPGMKKSISDFSQYKKDDPKNGCDAHFVRVTFKKLQNVENFFPINKSLNEQEQADEIVLFNSSQFLPCFLLTIRRTK